MDALGFHLIAKARLRAGFPDSFLEDQTIKSSMGSAVFGIIANRNVLLKGGEEGQVSQTYISSLSAMPVILFATEPMYVCET